MDTASEALVYSYSASNTNSATVNTVNYSIILYAGETLTIGTCGVAGATSSGDTYLRLRNASGVEVASNDDACGVASRIAYAVPTSGTYLLRAGCYANSSCGGTLAFSITAPVTAGNLIAANLHDSLAVRSGGSVWTWGITSTTLVQVPGLTNVTSVDRGWYYSLAVRSGGSVWAWGNNVGGQLGDGTTTDRSTPVEVPGLTNVTSIAAGHFHSLAIRTDGSIQAWGDNSFGELGDGTVTNRSTPVQVQGL